MSAFSCILPGMESGAAMAAGASNPPNIMPSTSSESSLSDGGKGAAGSYPGGTAPLLPALGSEGSNSMTGSFIT